MAKLKEEFISPALIWKRIAAFAIDMLIIMIVIFIPFWGLMQKSTPKSGSFSEKMGIMMDPSGGLGFAYFGMCLLIFFYFYKMENKMGQTIGKRIMNLYVVSDIKPQKRWQFILRNAAFLPFLYLDVLMIIDPIVMLFTKSNQRLSELLGKTRVVEISKISKYNNLELGLR